MGLFDTFKIEGRCTKCGRTLDDWQSKDLDQLMNTYQIGDEVTTITGVIFSGVVQVYTRCEPSGLKMIDFKKGTIEYLSDEDPKEYCGHWNEGVVYIHNGVVKGLKVFDGDIRPEDIEFESFVCAHYAGETEGLELAPVTNIRVWTENGIMLIKDEQNNITTQGTSRADFFQQLSEAIELAQENRRAATKNPD